MNKHLPLICTLLVTLLSTGKQVSGKNCSCAANFCCNQYGYCGTGNDYCGGTCQAGACYGATSGNGGRVSDIVTDAFFNNIINQAPNSCSGKGFYTRASFLQAVRSYPAFGTTGSPDDSRREIAAFFAHVTHETGSLCYIEELNGNTNTFCDSTSKEWPCVAGQRYYGRGPLQLTWNYNYGPIGQSIGINALADPGRVARDPVIAWQTSILLWMNNGHTPITSGKGFGATIRALYGALECDGANPSPVTARVNYYTTYCSQFGVSPGNNLRC